MTAEEILCQIYGCKDRDDLEEDHLNSSHVKRILIAMEEYASLKVFETKQEERFKMPSDSHLIKIAIIFNDGELDDAKLVNMVSMCQFVIDRLHENGDVSKKSSKE